MIRFQHNVLHSFPTLRHAYKLIRKFDLYWIRDTEVDDYLLFPIEKNEEYESSHFFSVSALFLGSYEVLYHVWY